MVLQRPVERSLIVRQDQKEIQSLIDKISRSNAWAGNVLRGERNCRQLQKFSGRRRHLRTQVESAIFVTPAIFDRTHAKLAAGEDSAIYCTAKDISFCGIGFKHDEYCDSQ